jgi:diguanylate cyclase (GGDEF)-like protein
MDALLQEYNHALLIETNQKKQVIRLEASTYSIGRDSSNAIPLDSKWISRQHAILLRVTSPRNSHYAFRIIDGDLQGNRSKNGLWINGHRCFFHDLKHGDTITFTKEIKARYYVVTDQSDQELIYDYEAEELPELALNQLDPFQLLTDFNTSAEDFSETALIRLASFPELIPSPIIEADSQGKITYVNPAAAKQFPDLQEQQSRHPLFKNLLPFSQQERQQNFVRQVKVGNQTFEQCVHYIHESDLIRSYIFDVTDRVHIEEALKKSEATNRALLNAMPDLMLQLDAEGAILDHKPAKDFNLEIDSATLTGINVRNVFPAPVAQQIMHSLKRTLSSREAQVFEYELIANSTTFCYEMRLVISGDREVLAIVRNMTERKYFEKQLIHDALHDSLTGLPNRHLFVNRLSHVLDLSKRRNNYLFAVLFIDLDRFKFVNDSLGHLIGDQLLTGISRRLETCLRVGDTVARLGGDEFAILLEDLGSLNDANQIAERILQEISKPFNLENHDVFTTASIGIATGNLSYVRPDELLRDADTAMYHAKSLGKARYEIFDRAMHARVVALLQLDSDLRRAVERQEFQLYYQPIVALQTGKIVGFETLIRWQHPEKGLVTPGEFIEVAEETGLIIPIGEWILYEACHQAHQWQMRFPSEPPLSMSINLSGKQFAQHYLAEQLAQILRRTSLNPHSLKLEITESVVMENTNQATRTFSDLKALNVDLCIDDFGTGYSSLSYLHRFPIDILKIDRSFINTMDMPQQDSQLEITRAIVALAHNLGISVVAEGVETAAQLSQLRSLKCEFGQGFFFSKPLDARSTEALIETQPQW